MIEYLATYLMLVLALLLCLVTLPGTIELILISIGGVRFKIKKATSTGPAEKLHSKKICVVIPAHNEAFHIANTVKSIKDCPDPCNDTHIIVIADNCTDDTANIARRTGARVLIRQDQQQRGKGYALNYAFKTLYRENFDYFLIIDADTIVEPSLILEVRKAFAHGAQALQTRYSIYNPEQSYRSRIMNLALTAFNILRPQGREGLGLSVGIMGNGFALTKETLEVVPYEATSIVEDLEYHLRLIKAGRQVHFVDNTTIRGIMPVDGKGVATQRARWEGGRLRVAFDTVPLLFREVLSGQWNMLEPLLDLLMLPLAYHVAIVLALSLFSWPLIKIYAIGALAIVSYHVTFASLISIKSYKDLISILVIPVYILWKILILPTTLLASRKNSHWIRTERSEN